MEGLGGYNAKRNKSERKTNTVCIRLYVESKKYNKLVNINTNEANLQIRQTNWWLSWGQGREEGKCRGGELRGTNCYV